MTRADPGVIAANGALLARRGLRYEHGRTFAERGHYVQQTIARTPRRSRSAPGRIRSGGRAVRGCVVRRRRSRRRVLIVESRMLSGRRTRRRVRDAAAIFARAERSRVNVVAEQGQ